jgi:hypothetical protein
MPCSWWSLLMRTIVIDFLKHEHGGFAATTGVLREIPADKEEGLRFKVQICTEEHYPPQGLPRI